MSNASAMESLLFAALELGTAAERTAYLDSACAGDDELRRQVDRLLQAHLHVGDFLQKPAVERLAAAPEPGDATQEIDGSTDGSDAVPSGQRGLSPARAGGGGVCDKDNAFTFLQPSTRPDSLGRLGHYEVLEVLGQGGFGIVFRAFDDTLQRVVAIKVLAPELAATSPPRKRFLREARSSAKVRHEHVVQIYAVEEQPLPYLVMEFIPGETLQERLDRTGPLETAEVVHFGRQIAEGLAAAHATGLIHRDVKPANILIEAGPNQHVKITDFGLARTADDASMTQSGVVAGTPMFMAPEQAQGDKLDHRADLFSLGSVLYTMASGRPPFRANNTLAVLRRVAEDTPRAISEIIPEVPQWLCDLIARLHAKNPEDRIGTAKEVAELLARGLAPTQGSANVPSLPIVTPAARTQLPREDEAPGGTLELPKRAPTVRPRIRPARWAAAAVLLVVLLGGFGLTEATGVTKMRGTVIQLFSPEGTLEIQVDDPDVRVQIDGSDLVIKGAGVKEIRLKTGTYTVKGIKDGKEVSRDLVTVTKNNKPVVRVRQVAKPLAPVEETPEEKAAKVRNAAAWERVVAGLSAADQVKAVGARLKQLNPGFDGQVTGKIENDVVKGLAFSTAQVSDVSPVRALTHLKNLECSTTGKLTDLSPLKGLKLATLDVSRTQVSDLSPLRGMPLTSLTLHSCTQIRDFSPLKGLPLTRLDLSYCPQVEDLRPLKGLKLAALDLSGTQVSDLSPLQGMPLTALNLHGCGQIQDLTPLKGLPLTYLSIHDGPKVADFSPLKGMRLTTLEAGCNPVRDLSPLKGMPLTTLGLGNCPQVKDFSPLKGLPLTLLYVSATQVSNLELLKGMPLKTLYVDAPGVTDLKPLRGMQLELLCLTPGNITQGLDILRDMKSLQRIGLHHYQIWPAADFWERYDKGEFKK
jgi:eukaryotic-like serine/threonine-protein kinase